MASDNRPLSPHLQVYRPQLTSVLSILHRATGAALAVGTLLLVYWLWAVAGGPEDYAAAATFFGHWLVRLALFGWTFALYFHLCNGIRHLFWDVGYGFEIDVLNQSGWVVLVVSTVLTVLTWIAA